MRSRGLFGKQIQALVNKYFLTKHLRANIKIKQAQTIIIYRKNLVVYLIGHL